MSIATKAQLLVQCVRSLKNPSVNKTTLRCDEKAMDASRKPQAAAQGSPLGKDCNAADALYRHNPSGRGPQGTQAGVASRLWCGGTTARLAPTPAALVTPAQGRLIRG